MMKLVSNFNYCSQVLLTIILSPSCDFFHWIWYSALPLLPGDKKLAILILYWYFAMLLSTQMKIYTLKISASLLVILIIIISLWLMGFLLSLTLYKTYVFSPAYEAFFSDSSGSLYLLLRNVEHLYLPICILYSAFIFCLLLFPWLCGLVFCCCCLFTASSLPVNRADFYPQLSRRYSIWKESYLMECLGSELITSHDCCMASWRGYSFVIFSG